MSGYERSKAPLALMEQIIMILVFALASAVCLQAFVYSNNLSKTDERRHTAMSKAQQVTEYCKASGGDLETVSETLNGDVTEDGIKIAYPEDDMTVSLHLTEQTEYLQKARILVVTSEGEEVCNMDIAWQRGGQP